jgi:hypothetical protein
MESNPFRLGGPAGMNPLVLGAGIYIGGGVVLLILIILVLFFIFR